MSDSPAHLSLSVKSLQRLEAVNHERDFAFIVWDERYPCPSFVAEFLSPRLASLRSQDITIHEFSIETDDPGRYFETFLSMGFGHEVCLSAKELPFARSVCGELRNSDLLEMTFERKEGQISEAELKARLEFLAGVDGAGEIEVVASHLYELSVSDFDQLKPSGLEAIVSDPRLVAQDEDSVFEIVHRQASADSSYFPLLEFVRFEFLSADCMKTAIEFISGSFDSLTFGIWSSLRTRLALPVTPPSQSDRFKARRWVRFRCLRPVPHFQQQLLEFGAQLHQRYRDCSESGVDWGTRVQCGGA